MHIKKEMRDIANKEGTVKVLVTQSEDGLPHAAVKKSMHFSEDGKLVYLELLESSKSYKNFTRSLWYNQKVVALITDPSGESFRVIGKPERIIICGEIYEKNYRAIREKLGDVDLAAVCVIDPEEVYNETLVAKIAEQEEKQSVFKHLDRLAK